MGSESGQGVSSRVRPRYEGKLHSHYALSPTTPGAPRTKTPEAGRKSGIYISMREAFLGGLNIQGAYQPRNNDLLENDGIRPYFHLPSQVASLRIDPRLFRNVTGVEQ
jgi:hypothetical protein